MMMRMMRRSVIVIVIGCASHGGGGDPMGIDCGCGIEQSKMHSRQRQRVRTHQQAWIVFRCSPVLRVLCRGWCDRWSVHAAVAGHPQSTRRDASGGHESAIESGIDCASVRRNGIGIAIGLVLSFRANDHHDRHRAVRAPIRIAMRHERRDDRHDDHQHAHRDETDSRDSDRSHCHEASA